MVGVACAPLFPPLLSLSNRRGTPHRRQGGGGEGNTHQRRARWASSVEGGTGREGSERSRAATADHCAPATSSGEGGTRPGNATTAPADHSRRGALISACLSACVVRRSAPLPSSPSFRHARPLLPLFGPVRVRVRAVAGAIGACMPQLRLSVLWFMPRLLEQRLLSLVTHTKHKETTKHTQNTPTTHRRGWGEAAH